MSQADKDESGFLNISQSMDGTSSSSFAEDYSHFVWMGWGVLTASLRFGGNRSRRK